MNSFYAVVVNVLLLLMPFLPSHSASQVELKPHWESETRQNDVQPRLRTELIRERYCQETGSDTSANLVMNLQLRYTNQGHSRLIFFKHDNTVLREMVSRDSTAAASGRYLWDLSLTTVTGGKDAPMDRPMPGPSFVILAPGHSYDAAAELIVFVRRDAGGKESDGLPPGDYWLQVVVSTWPESESLAESLRIRWRSFGALWYGNVKSDPMRFKVERNPKLVKCPEQ